MGKYINRNSKTQTELPFSYGGVRTRAKTLALQKAAGGGGSFIQLRSRRLVKLTATKRQKENRVLLKHDKGDQLKVNLENGEKIRVCENDDGEGSVGENIHELEAERRSTRETTPCNLIRDPDTITTPGSSTKWAYSTNTNNRVQNSPPRPVPSTVEMEEFFTEPEKQQQKLFIEKYNFDPVNDKPLPGRYEWVKMDGTKNVD